jgi:hypothetical protein
VVLVIAANQAGVLANFRWLLVLTSTVTAIGLIAGKFTAQPVESGNFANDHSLALVVLVMIGAPIIAVCCHNVAFASWLFILTWAGGYVIGMQPVMCEQKN